MKKLCMQRFEEFGTAGHADRIKPIPLSAMAKRYARAASIRRSAKSFTAKPFCYLPRPSWPAILFTPALLQARRVPHIDKGRPIVDQLADHLDDLVVHRLAFPEGEFQADFVVRPAALAECVSINVPA